jgi:hypothetical protein
LLILEYVKVAMDVAEGPGAVNPLPRIRGIQDERLGRGSRLIAKKDCTGFEDFDRHATPLSRIGAAVHVVSKEKAHVFWNDVAISKSGQVMDVAVESNRSDLCISALCSEA